MCIRPLFANLVTYAYYVCINTCAKFSCDPYENDCTVSDVDETGTDVVETGMDVVETSTDVDVIGTDGGAGLM